MKTEEKQLLLIDLSARLPYGVKMWFPSVIAPIVLDEFVLNVARKRDENCKPYLRPMSSMTEEEKKIICSMNMLSDLALNERLNYKKMYVQNYTIETFDYFNEHHFDYRGLIEMGLALEAPEGMYKTE